jgi:DNA ligase-associated metallophosphoesterase
VSVPARTSAVAYQAAPEGSAVRIEIAGADTRLRASGALWLEDQRALVVADVHLEKGSAYASRGQLLPPYDSRDALMRLAMEIEALDPRAVILLGDALHDVEAEGRLAFEDAQALHALARGRDFIWVVGNHDPLPPQHLPGTSVETLEVCGLRLRHEPSAGPASGEAAGHLHPCARIKAGGRSVRRRCFATDGERLVLPAFGAYAGGLNVKDAAFEGLFARPPLIVALGPRRAHAVGWWSVGPD